MKGLVGPPLSRSTQVRQMVSSANAHATSVEVATRVPAAIPEARLANSRLLPATNRGPKLSIASGRSTPKNAALCP